MLCPSRPHGNELCLKATLAVIVTPSAQTRVELTAVGTRLHFPGGLSVRPIAVPTCPVWRLRGRFRALRRVGRGLIAQLAERVADNDEVRGSSPRGPIREWIGHELRDCGGGRGGGRLSRGEGRWVRPQGMWLSVPQRASDSQQSCSRHGAFFFTLIRVGSNRPRVPLPVGRWRSGV